MSDSKKLSNLKKIDLRKAWSHEAQDFTTWLAQEENLTLLSDEIGIDIIAAETEVTTGKFNTDLVAKEQGTERKIVVENQLESTNHDHLGKIITYAAGNEAEIIIWIVKKAREEHIKAIEWLNNHSDEHIHFFLIQIEIWQIDDSPFAPKFHIIAQPNEWAKTLKATSPKSSELTETKILQLEYWTKFVEYAQEKGSEIKFSKPSPKHWIDMWFGSSLAHFILSLNKFEEYIGCELYIHEDKNLYRQLESNKKKYEKIIGSKLEWLPLEEKKASRIKYTKKADYNDIENWGNQFEILHDISGKFFEAFVEDIKKFR